MRRRGKGCGNSLELLLDTICNMFGGILFLAILVTLMLQSPETLSRLTNRDQYEQAETLSETLDRLNAERDQLRESIERVHEQIGKLVPPNFVHDYTVLCSAQSMLQELERQRDSLAVSIETIQREIDDWNQNRELRERRTNEMVESIRVAEDDLKRYREEMATSLRLPEMRLARTSRYVGVIIRFGKVYFWHDTAALLQEGDMRLNREDFVVTEDLGSRGLMIVPDPLRGLDLRDPVDRQRFTSILRKFSPIKWRIDLTVWNDSFDLFQIARSIVVQEKFEYRTDIGDGAKWTDRGGSEDSIVQ